MNSNLLETGSYVQKIDLEFFAYLRHVLPEVVTMQI